MPQESNAEAGKRFAQDMRRIRDANAISVRDLHDETKIPLGLLEAFEETALFDHPQFNRVYLRSFVRTYAQVIGIKPDHALQALEQALSDQYAGFLAVEYLGEEPEHPPAAGPEAHRPEVGDVAEGDLEEGLAGPEAPDAGTETPTPRETEPSDASMPVARPEDEPPPVDETAEEEVGEGGPPEIPRSTEEAVPPAGTRKKARSKRAAPGREPTEEPADADEKATEAEEPAGAGTKPPEREDAGPPKRRVEETPKEEERERAYVSTTGAAAGARVTRMEEEWTTQSPPPSGRIRDSRRHPPREQPDRKWLIGGATIVVIAAVIWGIVTLFGGPGSDRAESPLAADTAAVEDTEVAEERPPPPARTAPTLGDTMNVWIIAAHGSVDPIRVTVDNDLRRPYWIDQGDSMSFPATDRIVIEELLDNVEVKIADMQYPTDRRDEQDRLVITRDSAQANLIPLPEEEE